MVARRAQYLSASFKQFSVCRDISFSWLASEIAYGIISKARNRIIHVGVSCTGKTLHERMAGIFSCCRAGRGGSCWRRAGKKGGGSLGAALEGALFERQLKLRSFLCSCFDEFVLSSTSCVSRLQFPLLGRLINVELQL